MNKNEIEFGKPITRWEEEYGLIEYQIHINGDETNYKAILEKGRLVTMVKQGYRLLPNQEAVKMADEAAEVCGLVPFDEFSGEWFVRMNHHVIEGDNRVHALYSLNGDFDVNGEKMHIGVGVHNSIDGTLGFGAGIFTFRNACANMVFAGFKGYEQAFDQTKTIEYIYQKHTKALEPIIQNLSTVIFSVMDRAKEIVDVYRNLADQRLTDEMLKKIKSSRISRKVLPDYVYDDEPVMPRPETAWECYNDITQLIWHNQDTSLKTKTMHFEVLHKVIPLEVSSP